MISLLPFHDDYSPSLFAGIPIQSTLSPDLTLQFAHLTTSIVADVRSTTPTLLCDSKPEME